MRRLLSALLALLLVSALIAGCGENSTPTPAATTPGAASNPAPGAAATPAPAPTSAPAPGQPSDPAPSTEDALAKAKTIEDFQCDIVITPAEGGTITGTMAFSRNRIRLDMAADGQSVAIIVDQDQKAAYMYSPQDKSALRISTDQGGASEQLDIKNPFDWEKNATADPKPLDDDTIDGQACAVYEITTETETSKVWLDKETGFPLRTDTTTATGTEKVECSNVKIGGIPDSTFEIPADTQIQDLAQMAVPTPSR